MRDSRIHAAAGRSAPNAELMKAEKDVDLQPRWLGSEAPTKAKSTEKPTVGEKERKH